mgnify:CR=1 FL=1|tara:strand:- start:508 stop:945 length:438 start_codon:yes stop_codon:yes gene_type:complete
MSREYAVKVRLTDNDTGATGSHVAGIYIPKDPRVMAILPKLDRKERNPDFWFDVYFPQLNRAFNLRYIYYNNRFWGGSRNEYRITHIREALGLLSAKAGDYLIISKALDLSMELHPAESMEENENYSREIEVNKRWSVVIRDGDF